MIRILDPASKMKRETRILLLRHAETSAPDVFHGAESDIGLGARGHLQAEAVAQTLAALAPDALYCSAMRRAVETADADRPRLRPGAPARRSAPRTAHRAAQRQVARGGDGRPTKRPSSAGWPATSTTPTKGANPTPTSAAAVVPAFEALAARHPGQTIVVVAHGIVIRVLLTTLLEGYGPEHFQAIAIPNAGVNDVRYDGERWRAERLAVAD